MFSGREVAMWRDVWGRGSRDAGGMGCLVAVGICLGLGGGVVGCLGGAGSAAGVGRRRLLRCGVGGGGAVGGRKSVAKAGGRLAGPVNRLG